MLNKIILMFLLFNSSLLLSSSSISIDFNSLELRELIIKYVETPFFIKNEMLPNGGKIKAVFNNGAVLVDFKNISSKEFNGIKTDLSQDLNIEYIEPNYTYTISDYGDSDDSRGSEIDSETLKNLDQYPDDPHFKRQPNMLKIDAPKAWRVTTGSRDVKIAVIDTGVDYTHPDLADSYWYNAGEQGPDEEGRDKSSNGIDDDNNGYIDDWRGWDFVNDDNDPLDDHGHGTHCAGVISAKGNDGYGMAGINWKSSVLGIKFLSASGSGSLAGAVKAIEYAVNMGFKISNNSWGGGGRSQLLEDTLKMADEKGHLFVSAAGNSSNNNDLRPYYPASYELKNIISVAATHSVTDVLAAFSNYGKTTVDLAAPGVRILSAIPGGYKRMSGTSMAAPHVAGAAALIKSIHPDFTHDELKERILKGVDKVEGLTDKVATGGRLNLSRSL